MSTAYDPYIWDMILFEGLKAEQKSMKGMLLMRMMMMMMMNQDEVEKDFPVEKIEIHLGQVSYV